jgi:hypothetical protein
VSEHVPPQNPRSDVREATHSKIIVDACCPLLPPENLFLKCLGRKCPLVEFRAANPKGIVETLIGPSAIAVDRNREALNAHFRHALLLVRCSFTAPMRTIAIV